jgi:predicted PurR-regulated permease PerM
VIVGSFDGDVLQPLVMGKAVNLAPLAIVLAIAIGSVALGIIGALIAVPIAGAIYGVMKFLTGRDPDRPPSGAPALSSSPAS